MTSRKFRSQRKIQKEAERKARQLGYQQSQIAAAASAAVPEVELPPNPELLDEFTAEEQSQMMAIRARVHARSGPTGPRTQEGKVTSSGNSLKHGLASGRVIIPGEDPAAFEALFADLVAEHVPAAGTEELLVQQMAQSWWLMQRAIRIQNQAFTETRVDTDKLALFMRYQTTHERAFYRALNTLIKIRAERRKSDPVGAVHASPVSQNARQTRCEHEFVSQSKATAACIPPSGDPKSGPIPSFHWEIA